MRFFSVLALMLCAVTFGQTPIYKVDAFAGRNQQTFTGTGQPLLGSPTRAISDGAGGYYVVDVSNSRVLQVRSDGTTKVVIGTGVAIPPVESAQAATSPVVDVRDLLLDSTGNLYMSLGSVCRVIRIASSGTVQFVAGNGTCGFAGDGGPARQATLDSPWGLALDPQGRLIIADTNNSRIRRVESDGTIRTIAGTGEITFAQGNNTPALSTTVVFPIGLATDTSGVLYIAESGYRRVRKLALDGTISTVAGTGGEANSGDNGPAASAVFRRAAWVAIDNERRQLYISDFVANKVRNVDLDSGIIKPFAGFRLAAQPDVVYIGGFSGDGGPALSALLSAPAGLTVLADGSVLIADQGNNRIRRVANSNIQTVIGRSSALTSGTDPRQLEFRSLTDVAVASNGDVYFASDVDGIIGRVSAAGQYQLAGLSTDTRNGQSSYIFDSPTPTSGAANNTMFVAGIQSIALGAGNVVYFISGGTLGVVDGATVRRLLTLPANSSCSGMTMDAAQTKLYLACAGLNQILTVAVNAGTFSTQSFAGTGAAGSAGDGGQAIQAQLNAPSAVAFDKSGNLFVADNGNSRIRKITAQGVISAFAGTGSRITAATFADNQPATATALSSVARIAVDANGNVTLAERNADIVRQIDAATGRMRVISGKFPERGATGDGLVATQALNFFIPAVAVDTNGRIFILDGGVTNRIRVLTPLAFSSLSLNGGNNQSGAVSSRLSTPLSVKLTTSSGTLAGIPVRFAVTAGTATLDSASPITNTDGVASVNVTLGSTAGPVTVTAQVDGLPVVTFALTATGAASGTRPTVGSATGANAFGGLTTVSPGMWMEVFGTNFATVSRSWLGSEFQDNVGPTQVEGVGVTIGGKAAFIAFVSPTQINLQVPDGVPAGSNPLIVTAPGGVSDSFAVTVAASSPALLSPPSFLIGGVQYAAALLADGSFVGRRDLIPGAAFRPARAGDVLTIYALGLGVTNPRVAAGLITPGVARVEGLTATLGGRTLNVSYAGLSPQVVGLYQLNIEVPAGLSGDQALDVRLNGQPIQQKLTLTLQ